MKTRVWLWLMAVVLLAGCGRMPATTAMVERLDSVVSVRPDGGLEVDEAFTIAPDASGAVVFHRVIESPYADVLRFVSAAVDGVPVESGAGGFQVESNDDRLAIEWRETGLSPSSVLAITYSVDAAVAVRQPRGRLEWPVLAAGRGYDVGPVTIALVLPEGVRTHDGTGMGEAGWHVELTPRGVDARRGVVTDDESATLLAVFDIDHARVVEPVWERNLDRREQYVLALLGAGAFIVVVGVGILVQMRVQYPPPAVAAPVEEQAAARATRRMLSRGLWVSAVACLALAAVCAVLANRYLRGLGPAVQAIPGSAAFVGVLFAVAAAWYRRTADESRS